MFASTVYVWACDLRNEMFPKQEGCAPMHFWFYFFRVPPLLCVEVIVLAYTSIKHVFDTGNKAEVTNFEATDARRFFVTPISECDVYMFHVPCSMYVCAYECCHDACFKTGGGRANASTENIYMP